MPYAELSDVRSYYEVIGTGDPLLLIPGLGSAAQLWDPPVLEALSRSLSIITMDNRDIGRSSSRRPPQDIRDLAVDLVELLDHLQIDRAHILGVSLGGIVAQQFAIDHPSRLNRLVLVSCTNRFTPYLREMIRLLGQALRRFPPRVFRQTIELLGTSPAFLDANAERLAARAGEAERAGGSRAAIARQLRCLVGHDLTERQDYRIIAPTLVICGERDIMVPACYGRRMAEEIPGALFVAAPGCGHNPFIECPDFIVPVLLKFLCGHVRDGHDRDMEESDAPPTSVSRFAWNA